MSTSECLVAPSITCHSLQGEGWAAPLGRNQLPQNIMQNTPVLEVVEFIHGVDPAYQRDPPQATIRGDDLGHHPLAWLDLAMQPTDGNLLVALEAERLPGGALLETEGEHPHADQVGAVDALERLAYHGANAEQIGALGGPVARGAGAVLLPREDDQRHLVVAVAHRGIIDRHAIA